MAIESDRTTAGRAIPEGEFFCLICFRVIEAEDCAPTKCGHVCERCNEQLGEPKPL